MIDTPTCYMCERPSTSKEHAPPRCIFPETKDLNADFRKELITVPSCDEHNTQKSSDDEFLLVSLAGIIGNNSIGYSHKFTKVNRALYRSSMRLLDGALKNQRQEWIEFGPNQFIDVIWGTPDYERLNGCFDKISRAIFFDTFAEKFCGNTRVLLGYTNNTEPNASQFQRFIRDKVASELKGMKRIGANPDIFSYLITPLDQFGLRMIHLQFYGGMDIYVVYMPSGTKLPPNPAMELIELGVPTIISSGGTQYEFNAELEDDETAPG